MPRRKYVPQNPVDVSQVPEIGGMGVRIHPDGEPCTGRNYRVMRLAALDDERVTLTDTSAIYKKDHVTSVFDRATGLDRYVSDVGGMKRYRILEYDLARIEHRFGGGPKPALPPNSGPPPEDRLTN